MEQLRHVRRAVHTLKGDSAACGFRELSELAHRLEDVLTPELAARTHAEDCGSGAGGHRFVPANAWRRIAAMKRLPLRMSLRELINDLLREHKSAEPPASHAKPEWTEYERLLIDEASRRGERVYQVSVRLTLESQAIGFELARKALEGAGRVIAFQPREFVASATPVMGACCVGNHCFDRTPEATMHRAVDRGRSVRGSSGRAGTFVRAVS